MNLLFSLLILFISSLQSDTQPQNVEILWEGQQLIYNNHVGNEWRFGYNYNNAEYSANEPLIISTSGILKFKVYVKEIDKYTDEIAQSMEIDATTLKSGKIYSRQLEFVIKENMGRYAGNLAKWVVTIKYRKVNSQA